MKKSKIICIIGVFIIATTLICNIGKEQFYRKQRYFNTPEEVISIINNTDFHGYERTKLGTVSRMVYNPDFLECLSKRKRLTSSTIYWDALELATNEEGNTEENLDRIRRDYINGLNRLEGVAIPSKIKPYSFKAKGYYYGGSAKEESEEIQTVEMVLIDEGEGWVIDYFYEANN